MNSEHALQMKAPLQHLLAATLGASLLVFTSMAAIAGSLETPISHRYCDVEEQPSGSISRSSNDLEMTQDGGDTQVIGLCFSAINLPPGADITNAYIQFTAKKSNESTPTLLSIEGHADPDSVIFSRTDFDVSSRARTTASVQWAPNPWLIAGEAGAAQRTPNIASIVEEIIAIPGWQTGNAVTFIISGTGKRTALSYFSTTPEVGAVLHVDFIGAELNLPPEVDAGDNLQSSFPAVLNLDGTVVDDGLPQPTPTTLWEHVGGTGGGTVSFANAAAIDTVVTISDDPGTYRLRLTANDGEEVVSDEIEIAVYPTGITGIDVPIYFYADDAEEDAYTGEVDRHSSDMELVNDGRHGNQIVGLRFQAVNVPKGSPVTAAYIQFTADETDNEETTLTIYGQAGNNPGIFVSSPYDISSRPTTSASASWSPAPWNTPLERGPAQRTADLTAIVQELVDRAGWAPGNSMAFIISGAGQRTAISRNNGLAYEGFVATEKAPTLHIEYDEATGNRKPFADGGEDKTILFPTTTAFLDATVTDDGLPDGTLNILWEHIGGTGTGAVSIGDPTAIDTPVTLSQNPGIYILRLTVSDGDYTVQDEVTISAYFSGAITGISQVNHTHTGFDGVGNPLAVPAIDPAGIVYHEPSGSLFIADSEINEVLPAFEIIQANLFNTNVAADSTLNQWDMTIRQINEPSRNREPTGITYCATDNHFYISNDDARLVYRYSYDGFDFTMVDWMDISQYTHDPEGISCDPSTGRIYVTGGVDIRVVVIEYSGGFNYIESLNLATTAGDPNGIPEDGEGIAFDPGTGHLFVLSDPDHAIFEYTTAGSFVQKLDISNLNPTTINAQGLSVGPSSSDPQKTSFYLSDAAVDNDYDPNERDGMIYEIEIQRIN